MQSEIQSVKALLRDASAIIENHEEIATREGTLFNIFRILGRFSDEEKGHSAFIATLLNPNGSHKRGGSFFELFLSQLEISASNSQLKQVIVDCKRCVKDKWKCYVEKSVYSGRIDILLVSQKHSIAIENKIHANDQDKQLVRYNEYLVNDSNLTGRKNLLVYLTLHGTDASKFSKVSEENIELRKNIDYLLLSYKDISAWLSKCTESAVISNALHIKENIDQYNRCIKSLRKERASTVNADLSRLLLKDNNILVLAKLNAAFKDAKVAALSNFFSQLIERLQGIKSINKFCYDISGQSYKIKSFDFNKYCIDDDIFKSANLYYSKEKLRSFGVKGQIYKNGELLANLEVRVNKFIYYGFWDGAGSNTLNQGTLELFCKKVKTESNKDGRVYINTDLNYRDFNGECAAIVSNSELILYIEQLIDELSDKFRSFCLADAETLTQ